MFAVVQIGSNERRSPCITARMVLAAAGCAWARMMFGAVVATPAARPVRRIVRRDTPMCEFPRLIVVVALRTSNGGILRIGSQLSSARRSPGDVVPRATAATQQFNRN